MVASKVKATMASKELETREGHENFIMEIKMEHDDSDDFEDEYEDDQNDDDSDSNHNEFDDPQLQGVLNLYEDNGDRGGLDDETKDVVGALTALKNGVRRYTVYEDQQNSSTNRSISMLPFLEILSSKKTRNPPYLVKKELDGATSITTKKGIAIEMIVHMDTSMVLELSLRYTDASSRLKPVHKCVFHTCQMCKSGDHPERSMFCIVGYDKPVEHTILDEHITYMLRHGGEYSIMFVCRSSCDPHRNKGKDMVLLAKFFEDNADRNPICEQKIRLRCCENVKRDHLDGLKAKKRMAEEQGHLPLAKKSIGNRLSDDEEDHHAAASVSSTTTTTTMGNKLICIQVNNEAQLQMYKLMAEQLGNSVSVMATSVPGIPKEQEHRFGHNPVRPITSTIPNISNGYSVHSQNRDVSNEYLSNGPATLKTEFRAGNVQINNSNSNGNMVNSSVLASETSSPKYVLHNVIMSPNIRTVGSSTNIINPQTGNIRLTSPHTNSKGSLLSQNVNSMGVSASNIRIITPSSNQAGSSVNMRLSGPPPPHPPHSEQPRSSAPVGSAVIRLATPSNIRPGQLMVANINGIIPKSNTHRATT